MGDLVQARRLGQTLCWALMHQPHLGKIWEYQNGFQFVILFPNCLIFQLSLLGMAYVLFNRRAHLQRLPVLCTIVCRRRQTNQTVNVTRENIAFFKEMIFFIFFLLTRYQSKISGIGVTPLTSSTVHWHTQSQRRHSSKFTMAFKVGLHSVFFLHLAWLLGAFLPAMLLPVSCQGGGAQGRWPSRYPALQGLRPVLCCVPCNERLAGYLMWSYI